MELCWLSSLCSRRNNMETKRINCRKLAAIMRAGIGQYRPLIKGLDSRISVGTYKRYAHYR